jgi:hypothetical protein
MEKDKLIQSYWSEILGGKKRKYFHSVFSFWISRKKKQNGNMLSQNKYISQWKQWINGNQHLSLDELIEAETHLQDKIKDLQET